MKPPGVTDPRGPVLRHADRATPDVVDGGSTALAHPRRLFRPLRTRYRGFVSAPLAAGLAALGAPMSANSAPRSSTWAATPPPWRCFSEGQSPAYVANCRSADIMSRPISRWACRRSLAHAERLKALYGNCHPRRMMQRELLPVPSGRVKPSIRSRKCRARISLPASARDSRKFSRWSRTGWKRQARPCGAMAACAYRRCLPTRRRARSGLADFGASGAPRAPARIIGLPDSASGPGFATLVGLLAFATGDGQTMHDIDFDSERGSGWFGKLVDFLKNRI